MTASGDDVAATIADRWTIRVTPEMAAEIKEQQAWWNASMADALFGLTHTPDETQLRQISRRRCSTRNLKPDRSHVNPATVAERRWWDEDDDDDYWHPWDPAPTWGFLAERVGQ